MRQLCDKAIKVGKQMHICYTDMEKVFDGVERKNVWRVLEVRKIEKYSVQILKPMQHKSETSKNCNFKMEFKQDYILSPMFSNPI